MRKGLVVAFAVVAAALSGLCAVSAGDIGEDVGAMLTADGGFFALVGPGHEATVINGLGGGFNYRPIVTTPEGTRPSRLVFSVLIRQGDPNVGKVGVLYNLGAWEGVDAFVGGSALGVANGWDNIALGGTVDVSGEFLIGNQVCGVKLGGGYLSDSRYPISASLTWRTP